MECPGGSSGCRSPIDGISVPDLVEVSSVSAPTTREDGRASASFLMAMSIVSRTIDYPCRETGVLAICCRSTAFGVRETMANAFLIPAGDKDIY